MPGKVKSPADNCKGALTDILLVVVVLIYGPDRPLYALYTMKKRMSNKCNKCVIKMFYT